MKTKFRIVIAVFVVCLLSSFQILTAQDKSKENQDKEIQILKSIDEQKKAMGEAKKASSEENSAVQETTTNNSGTHAVTYEQDNNLFRVPDTHITRDFDFMRPSGTSGLTMSFWGRSYGDDSERTSWDLSRSVKESNFTKEYTFEVEKTATNVVLSITGDCKTGEIRIKIIMPDGKNYSDIVIDEFGNLNWRKSFKISDTENKEKAGEWKFQVVSVKATGYFNISMQSY
jgi:hypothetical protein